MNMNNKKNRKATALKAKVTTTKAQTTRKVKRVRKKSNILETP